MEVITLILYSFLAVLFVIIGTSSLYLLIFSISSKFFSLSKLTAKKEEKIEFHVLVPAYKNDAVLLESVKHNLACLKSANKLAPQYWVLGDHLKDSTSEQLTELGVQVFNIHLNDSTKARAINQWIEKSAANPNLPVLLLDVDNLLDGKNLEPVLRMAVENHPAWYQFQRTSANTDTEIAGLDTWSELVNNELFRKGAQALGVRPAVIGSAMLAPFSSFAEVHQKIDVTGGFDKWVEHHLIKEKIPVIFEPRLKVFDQKIAEINALKKQRTRWVAAQFFAAKKLLPNYLEALLTLRWKAALKYYQLYLPPKVLHLAFSGLFLLSFFINLNWGLAAILNLLVLFVALALATPSKQLIPVILLFMKNSLNLVFNYFGMFKDFKKANKKFLVTEHKSKSNENSD